MILILDVPVILIFIITLVVMSALSSSRSSGGQGMVGCVVGLLCFVVAGWIWRLRG